MFPPVIYRVLSVAAFLATYSAAFEKPPLFLFDDPHDCQVRSGTYCVMKTVLEQSVSPAKLPRLDVRFRRDLLQWGLCTKQCEDEVRDISLADRLQLFVRPKFTPDFMFKIPSKYFAEMQYFEPYFGETMQLCVNNRMWGYHNLTGIPYIENCFTNNHAPWVLYDWFACIFFMLSITILVTFSMSNILDMCGPRLFKRYVIIRSVSIRKNWEHLTNITSEDKVPEIRCIEGLRFLLTIGYIVYNCFMMVLSFPVINPDAVEHVLKMPLIINLLSCAFWLVPVFLTVDGFLMMKHFQEFSEKLPDFSARYFRDCIVFRLIEMVPLYSLAVLYHCVMDTIWGGKPSIGKYLMLTKEARICRRNFWANMAFVNNYPVTQEMCFGTGWYFATSLQLYGMGCMMLAFLWAYPPAIKLTKRAVPIISVLLPGVAVLFFRSEPLPPLNLTDISEMFMYQTWYRTMHLPAHMNMGNYVLGMLAGYYCHLVRSSDIDLNKSALYRFLKRIALPLTLIAGTVPFLFYRKNILKPGLLTAGYAIIFHYCCSLYVAICLLENFQNVSTCVRRFISSRLFIIPTRLCYSLFIAHALVLRLFLSLRDPRNEFRLGTFPVLLVQVFVFTFLLAIVLFLVVEQPCRVLFGTVLYPRPRRAERLRPRLVPFAPMEFSIEY